MNLSSSNALEFSEEQAMLLDVAQSFCADQSPVAAVREQLETALGFDEKTWKSMVDMGWLGIALPERCGGSAMGVGSVVPVVEAMGRGMLGTPFISSTLAAQLLLRASAHGEADGLLTEIAAGTVATVALLEDGDWGNTDLSCVVDAAGRVTGSKCFVTDVQAAQMLVVVARQEAHLCLAVVNTADLPQGGVHEQTLIDQTRRSANIEFSDTPAQLVIRGEQVQHALRDHYLLGALLMAAEATGSLGACLDTITEYLRTRKQFGKLIGSYQALKHPSADILLGLNACRSLIYHGATVVGEAGLDRDAEIACRMAKAKATEALLYAADRAVQFHGGMGFTYECDTSLYIRRAQWTRQQFGDERHHRKRLAALLLD